MMKLIGAYRNLQERLQNTDIWFHHHSMAMHSTGFTLLFLFLFQSLFRIIKPQKVLFLAVDGVAPRAKMHQQRGRRFRSAREAQDLVRKALQKGVILPSEPRFDSNCITPGQCITCQVQVYVGLKPRLFPPTESLGMRLIFCFPQGKVSAYT